MKIQNAMVQRANQGNGLSSMDCSFLVFCLPGSYCYWNKPFCRCSSLSFSLALKYFDLFFGSPSLSDPESTASRCWLAFLDILWFDVIPNLLARVGDFSANALKLLCMRAWSWKNKQDLTSIFRDNAIFFAWKLQATIPSFYCKLHKPYFDDWVKVTRTTCELWDSQSGAAEDSRLAQSDTVLLGYSSWTSRACR